MNSLSLDTQNITLQSQVLEQLPQAIAVIDLESKFMFSNNSFESLTGFSSKSITGLDLDIIVPDENKGELKKKFKVCLPSDIFEFNTIMVHKNQSKFLSHIKVIPLVNDNNEIAGRTLTISIAKADDELFSELRERDERFRFLLSVTNEGIVVHENGIITEINQAALNIFGYKYENVIGKSVYIFSPQSEHDNITKTITQGAPPIYEREVFDANGNLRTVEVLSRTVNYNGREVRVLNVRDISEIGEKRFEEERLVSIIERSPLFIAMMDKYGLSYLNLAGRNLIGIKKDEVISGLTLKDLMKDESVKLIYEVAIPAAIRKGSWQGQTYLINRAGETIACYQTILAHRNKNNAVEYFSSIAENITDRLRSEQILFESQERLKYFMEESLEAIIIQHDGNIIDFNNAACKMFNYTPQELMGKSIFKLYDSFFHKELIEKSLSKQIINEEWIGVKKEGLRFDIEVYSRPHNYKNTEVSVLSILDISLRKKAERALRSSELLLNTAVEGTNVGIWEWNLVTNQVVFNHVKNRICGFTAATTPSYFDQWIAHIHPDDRGQVMEKLKSHMNQSSSIFHAVYRIMHTSGNWIFLESKGKIVHDENNLPVRCVGTSVDITERQQMENELRQSKAQLTALIENRIESIWSVDLDKRLVSFNKPFAMVYKVLYNYELKKGDLVTNGLKPEDAKFWIDWYDQCIKGKPLQFVKDFKFGEQKIFVEFAANPIRLPDDTVVGVSVLSRDITQQIKFEESLKQAKIQAEESNKSKSQFLANISHEIRTPMNGIMGFTDLLLESKLTPQQRDYLEIVRYSGESLLYLINDLLDISKIESGKMSLVYSQFDLAKLLKDIVRSFKAKAEMQQLKIVTTIDISIPKLLIGDPQRIQQIFVNLIGNSIKFSNQGKIKILARLKKMKGKKVIIYAEIEDEGIGIPKDKQESIFEAFNQVGNPYTNKFGGTGLGLSISQRLVKLMDGEIGVDSEPKKGSRFYFTISLQVP